MNTDGYLKTVRALGWRVAAHNDYWYQGQVWTFYLLTNPTTGRFVKGEAPTDVEALAECRTEIRRQSDGRDTLDGPAQVS